MRLRRCILTVLCCIPLLIAAQPRLAEPEMCFGFHGGVIGSMVRFNPNVAQSFAPPVLGANGGFVFRYSRTKYTAVQLELDYMRRGWHESATDYYRYLDYIEIPLLMHLYVGKKVRGFLNLGPQFGYCIAQSDKNGEGLSGHQYESVAKPWDWGLAAGLGLQVNTNKAGVYFLEARFDFSFGDLYPNRVADYFRTSAPMALSLNIGWLFAK